MTLAAAIARLAAASYDSPADEADDLEAVVAAFAAILPVSAREWCAAAEARAESLRDSDDPADFAPAPPAAELPGIWERALARVAALGERHGATVDREDTPDDHDGWAVACWDQLVDGSGVDAAAGDWPDDPDLRDAYVQAYVQACED